MPSDISRPSRTPVKLTRSPKQRRADARRSPRKAPPRGSWVDDAVAIAAAFCEDDDLDGEATRLGDSGCWAEGEIKLVETVFEMERADIRRYISPHLVEYYDHGDPTEVLDGIAPFASTPRFYPKLVALVVADAVDRGDDARRLASALLVQLEAAAADMAEGIEEVLRLLPELELDAPDAPAVVAKFVAKCVLDGLLPPSLLASTRPEPARSVFLAARVMYELSATSSGRIWSRVGPRSALADIEAKVSEAVKEYRDTADAAEVGRCVTELQVPSFHHQLVFAAILSSLEHGAGGTRGRGDMHALLAGLSEEHGSGVLTADQLRLGFRRIYTELPSIQLDLPWAYVLLHKFVADAAARGYIAAELAAEAPQKPRRKRRHTCSYD